MIIKDYTDEITIVKDGQSFTVKFDDEERYFNDFGEAQNFVAYYLDPE